MASKANLIFVQSLLLLLCTAGAGDVAPEKKGSRERWTEERTGVGSGHWRAHFTCSFIKWTFYCSLFFSPSCYFFPILKSQTSRSFIHRRWHVVVPFYCPGHSLLHYLDHVITVANVNNVQICLINFCLMPNRSKANLECMSWIWVRQKSLSGALALLHLRLQSLKTNETISLLR